MDADDQSAAEANSKKRKLNNGKSRGVVNSLNKNDDQAASSIPQENTNTNNVRGGSGNNDETDLGGERDTNPLLYDSSVSVYCFVLLCVYFNMDFNINIKRCYKNARLNNSHNITSFNTLYYNIGG